MFELSLNGAQFLLTAVIAFIAVCLYSQHKSRVKSAPLPIERPPLADTSSEKGIADQGNIRDNWLARRNRYGSVFRAQEANGAVSVYVGDALALKDILEQPDKFDMGHLHIGASNMWKISEQTGHWFARGGGQTTIQLNSHLLSGSSLASLQQRFVSAVARQLDAVQVGSKKDLFLLATECFFQATLEAMFTQTFPDGQYARYCVWDAELNYFCSGCPSKAAVAARDHFFNLALQQVDEHLSECSLQVREQVVELEIKHNLSHEDALGVVLRTVWLGCTQSPLAGAWLICLLSHHPEKVQTIRTELRQLNTKLGAGTTVQEIASNPDLLKHENLPTLDDLVNELLRVYSAQNIPRFCLQDAVVRTLGPNGIVRKMQFKQGDVLQLLFWNVHDSQLNPQWWPSEKGKGVKYNGTLEPFDETRFEPHRRPSPARLDNNETFRTWTPFGFGSRVCPGRYWAVAEIKAFCLLFFDRFDIHSPGEMPRPDPARWVGVLHALDPMPATFAPNSSTA